MMSSIVVSATAILKETLMQDPHWPNFLALVANELHLNLTTFRQCLNQSKQGTDVKLSWMPLLIKTAFRSRVDLSAFRAYVLGWFDEENYPDLHFDTLMYRTLRLIGHAGEINVQLDNRLTRRDAMTSLEICAAGFQLFGALRQKTLNAMSGVESGQEEMFCQGEVQTIQFKKLAN